MHDAAYPSSLGMQLGPAHPRTRAALHIYAGTTHDFGVRKSNRPYATWTDSCAHWLRDQGFLSPKREVALPQ